MIYKINTDNFKLSTKASEYLDSQTDKLKRYLPDYATDLPLLQVSIRHHEKRQVFEGSMVLHLPQQSLAAHFSAPDVIEGLKIGFGKIEHELSTLKGKHFINEGDGLR